MNGFSAVEKIQIILNRKNMTKTDLAMKLGQSKQNVANKMARNDLKESDIRAIAEALDCSVDIQFRLSNGDIV